jgi:hypothetical protein
MLVLLIDLLRFYQVVVQMVDLKLQVLILLL